MERREIQPGLLLPSTEFIQFIMSKTHPANLLPRGSAEYLSLKLISPGFSCPHGEKLTPGIASKIPARQGFFHISLGDTDISFLDTAKLCTACYEDVVPDGFLLGLAST